MCTKVAHAGVERLCLRVGASAYLFLSMSPGGMVTGKEQTPLSDNPSDHFAHLYEGMNYGLLELLSPHVQGGEPAVTWSDLDVHV